MTIMQKNEFIEKTISLIKYKKVRPEIKNELNSHIEDLKKEYIENEKSNLTKSEMEIEESVIQQMGDINDIARDFNKIYKPKYDWLFNLVCILLLLTGVIVNSFLIKQSIIPDITVKSVVLLSALALIGYLLYHFIDYKIIESFSLPLFIIALLLSVLSRKYGLLSEFSSFIFVLHIVSYVGLIRRFPSKICLAFVTFFSLASIVFLGKVNLIILCLTYLFLLVCHKKNKISKVVLIAAISIICFVLFALALFSADITKQKVDSFSAPESYSEEDGYIYIAKKHLLKNSNLIGKSSLDIKEYIGNISDYNLFTYIITEFGFIFSFLVISLFGIFIYKLTTNSFKLNDEYGKLIFMGISCLLSLQIILNILNGINVVPYLTVKLPFLTIDTYNLSSNIIMIFLLLSIYRRKNMTIK